VDIDQDVIQEKDNKTPLRVLLVEDNRINQRVALIIFEKMGYQYAVANDGQEAVDIFSEDHNFDIILMDLMMPVKGGFEASKEIRAYEKENNLPETPIIAVTASVVNDDITQCFYAGMNAYIPKPIKPDKLTSEIEKLTSVKVTKST
jgi:CheY-like chemotaxis protein